MISSFIQCTVQITFIVIISISSDHFYYSVRSILKYRLNLQTTEISSLIVLKISNAHHWKALLNVRLVVSLGLA